MARIIDIPFTQNVTFPHPLTSRGDYPIAIGGDLYWERLLMAYSHGIFPWYNEEPILWWYTSPRFVLFPDELKVSKSLKKEMMRDTWTITFDRAFATVMESCATVSRKGQSGTWLNDEMKAVYTHLHHLGWAHSAEVWEGDTLIGGLYGILIGNIFFGESMFTTRSNASKMAFVHTVRHLQNKGCSLIDCQQETAHLASFGARMIDGLDFYGRLKKNWLANRIAFGL